jgi:hypothetical protein
MVIGRSEIPVKLVKSGGPDVLDVAVVEVKYPKAQWQALSVVGFRSMQLEIAPECFHAVGFREADGSL